MTADPQPEDHQSDSESDDNHETESERGIELPFNPSASSVQLQQRGQPLVSSEEARDEYSLLKHLVIKQKYPVKDFQTLWQILGQNHGDTFPNLIRLAKIALSAPVQTAICERGFSVQNLIKANQRNRLGDNTLRTLMTLSIEGPPLKEFDTMRELALLEFKKKKHRRIFQKLCY